VQLSIPVEVLLKNPYPDINEKKRLNELKNLSDY